MDIPCSNDRGRYYRTSIICFVLGSVIGALSGDVLRSAYAQIPNAGQQRQEMNSGMQQLNTTMSEILSVLRTGTLKVRMVETDKTSGSGSRSSLGTAAPTVPRPVSPGGAPASGAGRQTR